MKELKLQGFALNGTNYGLTTFMLEFSIDGRTWQRYNEEDTDIPKYFRGVTQSDAAETVRGAKVPQPAIGRFIRLVVPRYQK